MEQHVSPTDNARRLESENAREGDALALAIADLDFVIGCCTRLLEDQQVQLGDRGPMVEDETYQKALWDAALAAFYKHYEHPAHASVSAAIESVLHDATTANVKKHFENWRQERHQRVTHPIGKDESFRMGVFRLPDVSGVVSIARRRLRVGDDGVEWFRRLAKVVKARVDERYTEVQDALEKELAALSDEEYQALPDLPLGDHRRPPGIEQPKRPTA